MCDCLEFVRCFLEENIIVAAGNRNLSFMHAIAWYQYFNIDLWLFLTVRHRRQSSAQAPIIFRGLTPYQIVKPQ